jgi:hypothetical protein
VKDGYMKEAKFMWNQTWKSSVAALMMVSVGTTTTLPMLVMTQPATAGIFAQNRRVVPAGTIIPLEQPDGKRIVVTPDESVKVTLVTVEDVQGRRGNAVIPRGTKVKGEFRPTNGGTAFYAQRIELPNGSREIEGRTNVIDTRTTVKKGSSDPIWQGALVGGGAATIISALVTRPGIGKTLLGAGVGAAAGWLIGGRGRSAEVIVVEPERNNLDLRLENDLFLSRSDY